MRRRIAACRGGKSEGGTVERGCLRGGGGGEVVFTWLCGSQKRRNQEASRPGQSVSEQKICTRAFPYS